MATILNADTISGGAVVTGDSSGELQLQGGGVARVTLNTSGAVGVGSSPAYGTSGQVLTSAGSAAAPTWTTVSSGLSAATQAQMETATSNTVAATPLNTNWHPGVAKVWIKCNSSGAIQASHNVSSITDDGIGILTVTIATDFSSVNYTINGTSTSNSGSYSFVTAKQEFGDPTQTVGAFTVFCSRDNGTLNDPSAYYITCFGDQ